MRKIGMRRALSTKPSSRQADPQFIQEDLDEHGYPIPRRQPTRKNTLLSRMFGRKNRHSDDDLPIHTGDDVVVHPPMHSAQSDHDYEPHSFAGAGTHLMNEAPPPHEHTIREQSVRGHSVRDHHSDHHSLRSHPTRVDHSVHGGPVYHDEVSRGYPTEYAASTVGGRTHVYEHDYGHEAYDPHERVTVAGGSPHHSPIRATSPRSYHRVPVPVPVPASAPATVIHDRHDRHSRSGSSSRSSRTGVRSTRSRAPPGEIEVNLMPGEKQEFEIGPNTQLIVPDDVELEISDGKGGWLPYHESLLRRPPREEVYVISGGSNFIVEDELGNILHRSQPSTYSGSAAPVSIAGSVTGRSTRSRRDDERIYVDG